MPEAVKYPVLSKVNYPSDIKQMDIVKKLILYMNYMEIIGMVILKYTNLKNLIIHVTQLMVNCIRRL